MHSWRTLSAASPLKWRTLSLAPPLPTPHCLTLNTSRTITLSVCVLIGYELAGTHSMLAVDKVQNRPFFWLHGSVGKGGSVVQSGSQGRVVPWSKLAPWGAVAPLGTVVPCKKLASWGTVAPTRFSSFSRQGEPSVKFLFRARKALDSVPFTGKESLQYINHKKLKEIKLELNY